MRVFRWKVGRTLAGVAAMGVVLVMSSPPASAELSGTNGCKASGTWASNGLFVDAATATGVITIPREDTVVWKASVTAPPGAYSGAMWLKLPPPLSKVQLKSWGGDSQRTANSDSYHYDIPSAVPGGAKVTLTGSHTDTNGTCSGSVTFRIDGSAMSSPITWVSLAATVLLGFLLFFLLGPLFWTVM